MLFPQNVEARAGYIKPYLLLLKATDCSERKQIDSLLLSALDETPPPSRAAVDSAFVQGLQAGVYLYDTVLSFSNGRRLSLKKTAKYVATEVARRLDFLD
jgi:hypothetical protein